MSDGFNEMLAFATRFFTDLKANNTKEFFAPRKDIYNTQIKKPAELFADLMAEEVSRITGTPHAPKVYRIYRDVRFAKDKTPYNCWLHMMWTRAARPELSPVIFWGHEPGETMIAVGVMGLSGDKLARYRAWVDTHGDAAKQVIADSGGEMLDFGSPPLKRVPKPFDPDHPHGDLLRQKGITLKVPVDPAHPDGLVKATNDGLKRLMPFWSLLEGA